MVSFPAISTASPFPSELPPLSTRDVELLASLLDLRFNLTALASSHKLPALDLIHWATSRPIRSYIRALREVTDDCTRLRQSQARRSAIDTLETIAVNAEDPIEKRRAASSLLRSEHPRRVPRATADNPAAPPADPRYLVNLDHIPRADGLPNETVLPPEAFGPECFKPPPDPSTWSPDQPYKPSTKARPTPEYSAEELVSRCAHDLLRNNDPYQAVTNLFSFLPTGTPVLGKPSPDNALDFLRQHRFSLLTDIVNASYEDVQQLSLTETAAVYTVSFLSGINTLFPGLRFQLERSPSGPHADCWLITRIDQENVPWRLPLPEAPPVVRYDPDAPRRPP